MSSRTLPPELIGTIARSIWEGGYGLRTSTITACMLVNTTFAKEFRRYLFHTLRLNDFSFGGDLGKTWCYLKACNSILQRKPEYAALVKNVVVAFEMPQPGANRNPHLEPGNFSQVATLLENLTSVESVFIGSPTPSGVVYLETVPKSVQEALLQLCTLPSITTIVFDGFLDPIPQYFLRAPNLKSLRVQNVRFNTKLVQPTALDCVWPPPSTESMEEEELAQRLLHLDLRGIIIGLSVFPKFLSGVTDLTGCYDWDTWEQQTAHAASKSDFLRNLDLEFDLDQIERQAFDSGSPHPPIAFPLVDARHLHTIRFKVPNMYIDHSYMMVHALAETLESLPSPSKLETLHLAMHNCGYASSDTLLRRLPPITSVAQSQGPAPGAGGATAGDAGTLAPAASGLSTSPVPWAKLDKLLANGTHFPALRQVTLEVSFIKSGLVVITPGELVEGMRSLLGGVLPTLKEGVVHVAVS